MGAAFVAGVLAVGVGAVAFYVTRLVLAREPLSEGGAHTPRARTDSAGDGEA